MSTTRDAKRARKNLQGDNFESQAMHLCFLPAHVDAVRVVGTQTHIRLSAEDGERAREVTCN